VRHEIRIQLSARSRHRGAALHPGRESFTLRPRTLKRSAAGTRVVRWTTRDTAGDVPRASRMGVASVILVYSVRGSIHRHCRVHNMALATEGQYHSRSRLERAFVRMAPDFLCTALNEWVAVGRRPISKNASKMLQRKLGGQEALPQALSDIRCVFEWCCPPVFK